MAVKYSGQITDGNDVIRLQSPGTIDALGGDDSVTGTSKDDILHGSFGNDTLSGRGGRDLLTGSFGNDVLLGGGDDDSLEGGLGNNLIDGGDGYDIVREGIRGSGNFTITNISIIGPGMNDTLANIEEVWIDTRRDETRDVTDTSSSNIIDASAFTIGNGFFFAGNSNDTVIGGKGEDTLVGSLGSDSISGGDGNDYLYGQELFAINDTQANDTLTGGSGADVFVIGGNPAFYYTGTDDEATITDFSLAQGDVIQVGGGFDLKLEDFGGIGNVQDTAIYSEGNLMAVALDANLINQPDAFQVVIPSREFGDSY
jgi:Ca2+-binding RTX toxin-like protein